MLRHALPHQDPHERAALRATAKELLSGADSLLTRCEREQRDPLPVEDDRLASIMARAARLNARANGSANGSTAAAETSDRSLAFRAIAALVRAGGNVAAAQRLARESMRDPEAALVLKAIVSTADGTTAAWAGDLCATLLGDFIPLLRPQSALFALAADQLLPLPLGAAVKYPRRATGVASGFVAEGAAIPVREWTVDGVTLTPKKAAGMVVATRELILRADAFSEAFVLGSLSDDLALGTDQVFLSASASSTAAPAGLFHTDNAASAIAATAGADAAACATDLANLLAAAANFARPVLLIHPTTLAKAIALSGSSSYTIIQSLPTGRIGRVEVLEAGNITASTVAIVNREGLLIAGGDGFEMDVSMESTLHMDDAPNADLLAPTSGGINLYQRDMVAAAVRLPITWRSKRTSDVRRVDSATWA